MNEEACEARYGARIEGKASSFAYKIAQMQAKSPKKLRFYRLLSEKMRSGAVAGAAARGCISGGPRPGRGGGLEGGLPAGGGGEEPDGAGVPEEEEEVAAEMEGHDAVHGTDELPPDEDGRHRRAAADEPGQRPLHLPAVRLLVELVDGVVYAEVGEEGLHGVAQAAGPDAEDHHRLLRSQPHHPLHREIDLYPFSLFFSLFSPFSGENPWRG